MSNSIELVIKIGSMALISREDNDIDYNIFARLSRQLRPGMILVSSGATEIGRVDYIKRMGKPLEGDDDTNKTDYSAQGQSILMETYRRFVPPEYAIRQVLVEHNHFNDEAKRQHLYGLLMRCPSQNAIPIINYNDCVSDEENRKMELSLIQAQRPGAQVVECVDNDETAAVVAELVHTKQLILLTSTEGIYLVPGDPSTLIRDVTAPDRESLRARIDELKTHCKGASRSGANGAGAKIEYAYQCAKDGVEVIIGSPRYRIKDLQSGTAPCTRIRIEN